MKITLATTSFTPVYSKEANLQQYFKYIDKAAEKNARLIVFPRTVAPGSAPEFSGSYGRGPDISAGKCRADTRRSKYTTSDRQGKREEYVHCLEHDRA